MRSESPYYSRPSLAKTAGMRNRVQCFQLHRWLRRLWFTFDSILVISRDNRNVDRFPYFNLQFETFSPKPINTLRSGKGNVVSFFECSLDVSVFKNRARYFLLYWLPT